jgi:GNAT superfamily N-acetyltransferase
MTFKTTISAEESYENQAIIAYENEELVGTMSIMISEEGAYLERIDVDESKRNMGYGSKMIAYAASLHGFVYAAPDNADSERLFARIGSKMDDSDYGEVGCYVDQGYGVYTL